MSFNLNEQWLAGRNGHVCGRRRGVEGKRKLLSDRSPVKRANSCYPACQISFFLRQNLHFFRVMCDLAFCGNFLKEQCRKCPMCAALQGMMRLESREVQAEGLIKVFFTHNQGSTGFGGCMVVGSGVSRSYQGPGPPFPHPTPFILLLVWIPPLTFIVRRAKCTFRSEVINVLDFSKNNWISFCKRCVWLFQSSTILGPFGPHMGQVTWKGPKEIISGQNISAQHSWSFLV